MRCVAATRFSYLLALFPTPIVNYSGIPAFQSYSPFVQVPFLSFDNIFSTITAKKYPFVAAVCLLDWPSFQLVAFRGSHQPFLKRFRNEKFIRRCRTFIDTSGSLLVSHFGKGPAPEGSNDELGKPIKAKLTVNSAVESGNKIELPVHRAVFTKFAYIIRRMVI